MRAFVLALLGACVSVVSVAGPAQGAPVIKIKARTDVTILPVVRQGTGVLVRGEVVRRHSREPVIAGWVNVKLDDEEKRVQTDGSGVFEAVFLADDGRYNVRVAYEGGDYTGESEAEQSDVDVGKQNLRLGVSAENVSYGKDTIDLTVTSVLQSRGISVELDIYAGSAGALEPVGKVDTNEVGLATYALKRADLGGPGRKRIVVKFGGDASFNPTEAQTDLMLATETETELTVAAEAILFEADLAVTGRVRDESGAGIAEGPVALKVGARRLASTLSDEQGNFQFQVPGAEIGSGRFHVQAVFEPSTPWHRKSRSEVSAVEVAEPQPVPIAQTLVAFGATAVAMMAFFGLRTRPWESWMNRMRPGSRSRSASEEEAAAEVDDGPVEGGLRSSYQGIVSRLRGSHDFEFSGIVHDAVTHRPVPDAVVAIQRTGGASKQQACDARGRFRFEALEADQWSASVAAPGFVTERFTLTIPHRGELRDAYVDLVPVRERIFAMYREVAEPLLPGTDKWGIWTPRQIFRHVRAQQRAKAMSKLTDFVEEAYFSQRTPQESILDQAAQQIESARDEVAVLVQPVEPPDQG